MVWYKLCTPMAHGPMYESMYITCVHACICTYIHVSSLAPAVSPDAVSSYIIYVDMACCHASLCHVSSRTVCMTMHHSTIKCSVGCIVQICNTMHYEHVLWHIISPHISPYGQCSVTIMYLHHHHAQYYTLVLCMRACMLYMCMHIHAYAYIYIYTYRSLHSLLTVALCRSLQLLCANISCTFVGT